MTDKPIDEAEARRILEKLARNGPPTAQVAAIKVLREMDGDAAAEAEPEPNIAQKRRSYRVGRVRFGRLRHPYAKPALYGIKMP